MRLVFGSRALSWSAVVGAAAGGLAFAALFLGSGSSQGRLFWIGAAAVVVASFGWVFRPVRVSGPGALFFAALAAFVVWQGLSISWSIQPSRSWDYTNRGLVYFAFAAVGALVATVPLRRVAAVGAGLLGALFVWALAAKVVPGLYSDYGRLARLDAAPRLRNRNVNTDDASVEARRQIAPQPAVTRTSVCKCRQTTQYRHPPKHLTCRRILPRRGGYRPGRFARESPVW